MLPVESRKDDLNPGRDGPAGGEEPPRVGRFAEDEIGQCRDRGQPEGPAPAPPPDQPVGVPEGPGELALGVGVAGQPADDPRRGIRFGQGVGRQCSAVSDDIFESGPSRTAGQDDRRRNSRYRCDAQTEDNDIDEPAGPASRAVWLLKPRP